MDAEIRRGPTTITGHTTLIVDIEACQTKHARNLSKIVQTKTFPIVQTNQHRSSGNPCPARPKHSMHFSSRKKSFRWSLGRDLNPRPTAYKAVALPAELSRRTAISFQLQNKKVRHIKSRLETLNTQDVTLICAKLASEIVWLGSCSHKEDATLHQSDAE